MKHNTLLSIITLLLFFSCGSRKNVIYFQNIVEKSTDFTDNSFSLSRIGINDNLHIYVSAKSPTAAARFNSVDLTRGSIQTTTLELTGYLVDEYGEINFPTIGKIRLAGLTKTEASEMLQNLLAQYIEEPIVNIRFLNYKVTVLGEVNRPGTFSVNDEKISIPEALSLAGDLTIYGDRKKVLIMRAETADRQFFSIDLTKPDVVFSPQYFLKQNDVIYVSPNSAKAGSASINPLISLSISIISISLAVYSFFFR